MRNSKAECVRITGFGRPLEVINVDIVKIVLVEQGLVGDARWIWEYSPKVTFRRQFRCCKYCISYN